MRRLYYHKNEPWAIIRIVSRHNFEKPDPNMEMIKAFRDYLGADHVVKDPVSYLFLEKIEEIEYVECKDDIREDRKEIGVETQESDNS